MEALGFWFLGYEAPLLGEGGFRGPMAPLVLGPCEGLFGVRHQHPGDTSVVWIDWGCTRL